MKSRFRWLIDAKSLAYFIIGITAFCALVYGLYLNSPLYIDIDSADSMARQGEQVYLSYAYIVAPLATYFGMARKKFALVKYGSMAVVLLYLFAAALRVFTIGLLPLGWLFILAMGVISGLAWLVLKQ